MGRSITAIAAAAAATVAATAAGAGFLRLGFIDLQGASAVFLAIERGHCGIGFGGVGHFDKAETLRAVGVPVDDDLGAIDGAKLGEERLEPLVGHVIAEV